MIFKILVFCFVITIGPLTYGVLPDCTSITPILLCSKTFWQNDTKTSSKGNSITVKPDRKKDLASGSSLYLKVWRPGGTASGLWIGHANHFDHRYRVLMRFDIVRFIIAGTVRKATLSFTVKGVYGKHTPRKFRLQYFINEKMSLAATDLIDNQVKTVRDFVLDKSMKYPATLSFDVTREVNLALSNGFESLSFRVLDIWGETHANPNHNAAGTSITPESVKLDVVK